MEFLGSWFVTTIATMAAIAVVPGIEATGGSWMGPIMCALALSLVNVLIKPLAQIISLPITILTLGIFYLVVNALMLELASYLSLHVFGAGITISSFGEAFLGALIISIVSAIISAVTGL